MTNNVNNLFYLCSLIENISRITSNTKSDIIDFIGKEKLGHIYSLADVYHSEDIKKVSYELIEECHIKNGKYERNYKNMPSIWDIGKVYQRLIVMISVKEDEYIDALIEVLKSWIILKIDNYNSSLYYENPEYIYACYKEGKIL